MIFSSALLRLHFGRRRPNRGEQFALRAALEQVRSESPRASSLLKFDFSKNIADALEGYRQRLKVLRLANGLQRDEPFVRVHQIVDPGAENGVDLVVAELLRSRNTNLARSRRKSRTCVSCSGVTPRLRWIREQRFRCRANRQRQRDRQLALKNNLHDSQRRAPQRVRIARTSRNHANRKAPHDGIQLVPQRYGTAGQISRNGIFEADRTVVIVNRIGDVIRFALCARVESADDSLQLRKLAHHLGSQIALGKFRGAIRFRHMRLQHPAIEPLLR